MISWIQKYFQKHFRLVFLVVLLAIGLPMVFIYSQSSGIGQGGQRVREQLYFGINLANQEQATRVFGDGQLSAFLRTGYQGLQGGELQQYSLQRVAGLALADQLHLPAATPAQVSRYVTTLRAFQNQQGQFDQAAYTRFGDQARTGALGFKVADVNRVLSDDVRLEALAKLLGGPGYVLPAEVRQQLARVDATWTVQVATLDYASFTPVINPSDEVLKKFHDDNAFRYEVPARPRISLIEFKTSEFTVPTAPTEEQLRTFYNANRSSFPLPADADKKDAPGADNFQKVRPQVEAAMRDLAARQLASKAANDLTVALYEQKLAANSPELAAFLAGQHRTPVAIAPFTYDNPPADRPWLVNYAEAISRLSKDRYFSDPLPGPDGFVVLLWNENLPGYKPLFPEVRERVLADYRESEKRRQFIERGNALKAQLQAAAKTGDFAGLAAREKLELKSYANFSLRQPPPDLPQAALASLSPLAAGQVSDLIGLGDKGLLVYVQEKKLPDLSPANPRYADIQKQLMAFAASGTEGAYLSEVVETELKRSTPAAATP